MSARSRDLPRRSCLSTPGSNEKFLAKAPTVPPTTTPTPTGTLAPTGTGGTAAPTATKAPAAGSGVTGKTGAAAPAGGSTHTSALGVIGFVPSGAPQTGFGGAAHSSHDDPLLVGSVLLLGAGLAVGFVMRRRRTRPEQIADDLS